MKLIINVLFILIIICSCSLNDESVSVKIKNNKKVYSSGDTIAIELYIPYKIPQTPAFYIFSDEDTLALPFDFQKGCAIYNAYHLAPRKHDYSGFVMYKSDDQSIQKTSFKIAYEIRE